MRLTLLYFNDTGEIKMWDTERKGENLALTYTVPEDERKQLYEKLNEIVKKSGDFWEMSYNVYLFLYNYLKERVEIPEEYEIPEDSNRYEIEPESIKYFDIPSIGP